MHSRARTLLAIATATFVATLLTVAVPARADGWENRLTVNGVTYSGPNAIVQAFNGLPQGDSTMTLQSDCEYESYQGGSITIPAGRNVTLVLNGFDLDVEGFALNVQGSLTIQNGTGRDTGDVAFEPWGTAPGVVVTGSLTLTSGEISSDNGPAVQTQGSGTFSMTDGKVDSDARDTAVVVASGGRVIVGGGSIENGAYNGVVIAAQGGGVQVSGGTFEPTAIPSDLLAPDAIQVSVPDDGELQCNVGTNDGILSYLNRLGRGTVTVVNGTLNVNKPIPVGVTVRAQAPGALQVNGTPTTSYSGTGQTPGTGGGTTPNPGPNPSYPDYEKLEPIYRLYNPYSYGRYYCEDYDDEALPLMRLGWEYEGVGWYAPDDGQDVYQLLNPYTGDHYWTMDLNEYRDLQRLGWRGEDDSWESAPAATGKPIYQLFNPYLKVNAHLWTSDANERGALVDLGWKDEGVKWYAAALPPR